MYFTTFSNVYKVFYFSKKFGRKTNFYCKWNTILETLLFGHHFDILTFLGQILKIIFVLFQPIGFVYLILQHVYLPNRRVPFQVHLQRLQVAQLKHFNSSTRSSASRHRHGCPGPPFFQVPIRYRSPIFYFRRSGPRVWGPIFYFPGLRSRSRKIGKTGTRKTGTGPGPQQKKSRSRATLILI